MLGSCCVYIYLCACILCASFFIVGALCCLHWCHCSWSSWSILGELADSSWCCRKNLWNHRQSELNQLQAQVQMYVRYMQGEFLLGWKNFFYSTWQFPAALMAGRVSHAVVLSLHLAKFLLQFKHIWCHNHCTYTCAILSAVCLSSVLHMQ